MIAHPAIRRGKGSERKPMNRVQLNNVDHHALRLTPGFSAELGHRVNQLPLMPSEFEEAQRDYPILFRRGSGGEFDGVALLGLDRDENLFLESGKWRARYVPAMVRREPFFLGEAEESGVSALATFIDLDDPRITESDGEPLFLQQGGYAPSLEQAVAALRTIHDGLPQSGAMFALFLDLELIQPVNVHIQLGDGLEYRIPDVFSIDTAQFSSLTGERLERLHRSGFLPHAIFARSSLANITRLIELKAAKLANG